MVIHRFEEAGLGKAPFRFVRIETRKYQACPGAPVQPGGSCAYCGEGIMECCVIHDALGKEFIVGNVCVQKTGDRGLVDTVKRAVNRLRAEARHVRERDRINVVRELLKDPGIREALRGKPHPYSYFKDSKTLLDWAEWMLANAGTSGRLEVCHVVESLATSHKGKGL